MRPTDKEIEKQVNSIYDKQRKLYRQYKIKSFFGIRTKGIDNNNSLILNSILQNNTNDKYSFVVVNNIDNTDPEYIKEYHKKALRIDENNYVSIFFNVNQKFGDYVIGENIKQRLSNKFLVNLNRTFKKKVSRQNYINATEMLIKRINRQIASH